MKDSEAQKINELADQDIQLAEVDVTGGGAHKIDVVIAKGMTDAMCNADIVGEYRDWETDRKSTRLNSSH